MAAEVPILAAVPPGDARNIVERTRTGWTTAPDDVHGIRTILERSLAEASGEERPARGDDGDLAQLSREELYERAQKEDVTGRSSMSKDELVKALGG